MLGISRFMGFILLIFLYMDLEPSRVNYRTIKMKKITIERLD